MKLNLGINYIYPLEQESISFWWKESDIIEKIIERYLSNDFLQVRFFSADDKFEALDKIDSIPGHYRKFITKNGCFFYLTKDADTDSNYIEFYCSNTSIGLNLSAEIDFNSDQLGIMCQLALDIYNDHSHEVVIGPGFLIEVHEVSFSRFRPIRDYQGLEENALVNFIHPEYYSSNKNLISRQDEKLLTLPLPGNIIRRDENGLYVVQWIDSLKSEEQIRRVLTDREEFIYANLNLEPINDFNEFGDKRIFGISQLPKPPEGEEFFDYYNENNGMAFKLLTLNAEHEIDADTLSEIKEYLTKEKLHTGQPLNNITLLLPGRQTASAIEADAIANGIYKVLYLDNDTNVWDMHPLGDWRN